MSTTWASIAADINVMRDGNEDIYPVGTYSDTELQALMQTRAKREMKNDLIIQLNLLESDSDDMTILDEIADNYNEELAVYLAYKQMYLIYYKDNGGSESKTFMRMLENQNLYGTAKASFHRFKTDTFEKANITYYRRG